MAYSDNRKTAGPAANEFGKAVGARVRHRFARSLQSTVIHR